MIGTTSIENDKMSDRPPLFSTPLSLLLPSKSRLARSKSANSIPISTPNPFTSIFEERVIPKPHFSDFQLFHFLPLSLYSKCVCLLTTTTRIHMIAVAKAKPQTIAVRKNLTTKMKLGFMAGGPFLRSGAGVLIEVRFGSPMVDDEEYE